MTKYLFEWTESHECSASVEAKSEEEALEKWSVGEYLSYNDEVEEIDDPEICEDDD